MSAASKPYSDGCGFSRLSCIAFLFDGLQGQPVLAGTSGSGGGLCVGEPVPQEV